MKKQRHTAKTVAPSDVENSSSCDEDIPISQLSKQKQSKKKLSSSQVEFNPSEGGHNSQRKTQKSKTKKTKSKPDVSCNNDYSSLFDPINPTFTGFDPKTT